MPRRWYLTIALVVSGTLCASALLADDQAIWREYGLVETQTANQGKLTITSYRMKDTTGALAAWEWLRGRDAHPCTLAALCSQDAKRTVVSDFNWVLVFAGARPTAAQVSAALQALPEKHDSSLPAVLTYLPVQDLVANSGRYVLGPASLREFAPELAAMHADLARGGEAQIAEYRVGKSVAPVRLALFEYATPAMAREYTAQLAKIPNLHVKRAGVLVALTIPPADPKASDLLLSRVQYTAKITWNDTPPPSPIKPLYQLLLNIIYLSIILGCLCVVAGLIYAGMRIYRRRYGTLEAEEAMTTLRLTE
jgi:hypothetical protein